MLILLVFALLLPLTVFSLLLFQFIFISFLQQFWANVRALFVIFFMNFKPNQVILSIQILSFIFLKFTLFLLILIMLILLLFSFFMFHHLPKFWNKNLLIIKKEHHLVDLNQIRKRKSYHEENHFLFLLLMPFVTWVNHLA